MDNVNDCLAFKVNDRIVVEIKSFSLYEKAKELVFDIAKISDICPDGILIKEIHNVLNNNGIINRVYQLVCDEE